MFEKVTYELHPSFDKRAKQGTLRVIEVVHSRIAYEFEKRMSADVLCSLVTVVKTPPFRIEEEGWGEFEMQITLHALGKGGDHHLSHDLNFGETRYEVKHPVVSQSNLAGVN